MAQGIAGYDLIVGRIKLTITLLQEPKLDKHLYVVVDVPVISPEFLGKLADVQPILLGNTPQEFHAFFSQCRVQLPERHEIKLRYAFRNSLAGIHAGSPFHQRLLFRFWVNDPDLNALHLISPDKLIRSSSRTVLVSSKSRALMMV